MEKLNFKPRTLDDAIVREGLCALTSLEDHESTRGKSYVVGGIAAQSYLPSKHRRPTSDIDISVVCPMDYPDFRDFVSPIQDYFNGKGYQTVLKKGHITNQIVYFSEDGEAAMIEFPRRNEDNFKKRESILNREGANTRSKLIPGTSATYRVASPEDIAVPKLVRGIGTINRQVSSLQYLDKLPIHLSNGEVGTYMQWLESLKKEVIIHAGDPALAERFRFASDIFDIRALANFAGFNETYLSEVFNSWDSLKERTQQSRKLVRSLFPKIKF